MFIKNAMNKIMRVTKISATVAFVILVVFSIRSIDLQTIAVQNILVAFLFSSMFILASILLNAWRHACLVSIPPAPLWVAFKSLMLSTGLNMVFPGRVAEIVKITYLRKAIRISLHNGAAALIFERLLDIMALLFLGLLIVFFTPSSLASKYINFQHLSVQNSAIIILGVILMLACLGWLYFKGSKLIDVLYDLYMQIKTLSNVVMRKAFLITIGVWLLQLSACVLFFKYQTIAFVAPLTSIFVFVAINFAVAVPGPPAGIGLFQAATAAVLLVEGVSLDTGLILGVLLQIAFMWSPILASLIIMAREEIGFKSFFLECVDYVKRSHSTKT